jgi:hypothetical protein
VVTYYINYSMGKRSTHNKRKNPKIKVNMTECKKLCKKYNLTSQTKVTRWFHKNDGKYGYYDPLVLKKTNNVAYKDYWKLVACFKNHKDFQIKVLESFQKTKRRSKMKGGMIWGEPDADTDYRELAVMVSSASKASDVQKLYHEFKANWDNIVKEKKENAFYGRLSGQKAQLWKDIIVKFKGKSRSKSRKNKMQSLYTKQRTKMKGLVK